MVGPLAGVLVLGQLRLEPLRPQFLTGLAIQAQQVPDELLLVSLAGLESITGVAGHVDSLADDQRTGRARSRCPGLPRDVLPRGPGRRQAAGWDPGVTIGSSPTGPLGSGQCRYGQSDREQQRERLAGHA